MKQAVDAVTRYWFGANTDDAAVIREKSALWWEKNPAVDAEIRRRFEPIVEAEARGELASWSATAEGQLARILVCDQLPRNMYRGTARAFAFDERARQLACAALDRGLDRQLRPVQRAFVYMPFEHSEDRADQARCLELFTALLAQAPPALKPAFQDFLNYAVRHKQIIDRFGRFPHRNVVLGRDSTPEEIDFLKQPGSSF